jgi:cytochrome c oxidase assembly protein Cox11
MHTFRRLWIVCAGLIISVVGSVLAMIPIYKILMEVTKYVGA